MTVKLVLLVNDSYFAYLIAKPIIETYSNSIQAVVFSSRIKGSFSRIWDVFKKTYGGYFIYRSLVDLITRYNSIVNQR